MSILNWLRGDQWTCECALKQLPQRAPQVKFVVHLKMHDRTIRFARYVDADEPDPISRVVEEIRAAAPDRNLSLSSRSLRRLRAALEKVHCFE